MLNRREFLTQAAAIAGCPRFRIWYRGIEGIPPQKNSRRVPQAPGDVSSPTD